jgi:hypothetical protein
LYNRWGNVHIGDINNFILVKHYQTRLSKKLKKSKSYPEEPSIRRSMPNVGMFEIIKGMPSVRFINWQSIYLALQFWQISLCKTPWWVVQDTCIISFVADQFLESSLITTLNKVNIDEKVLEILLMNLLNFLFKNLSTLRCLYR